MALAPLAWGPGGAGVLLGDAWTEVIVQRFGPEPSAGIVVVAVFVDVVAALGATGVLDGEPVTTPSSRCFWSSSPSRWPALRARSFFERLFRV